MTATTLRLALLALGAAAMPAAAQTGSVPMAKPPAATDSLAPPPPAAVAPVITIVPRPAAPAASLPTGVPGDSPLNGGDRTSAVADVVSTHSVGDLLQRAEQAVRQNNLALANELVERAEAQVLTRSTIAGTETTPDRAGPVGRMAEARAAIARRDGSTAVMLIAEAASLARAQGM